MNATTTGSTSTIVLTAEQVAALAPLFALVGVNLEGDAVADQTPEVTLESATIGTNAAGKAIYLDGPRKGKYAPSAKSSKRPTKAQKAKAEKSEAFVGWLRETAEARTARKESNAQMAAFIRDLGFVPNGRVWAAVKAGERTKKALAPLAALDKADREATKAANA